MKIKLHKSLMYPIVLSFVLVISILTTLHYYESIGDHKKLIVLITEHHENYDISFNEQLMKKHKLDNLNTFLVALIIIIPIIICTTLYILIPIRKLHRKVSHNISNILGKRIPVKGHEIQKLVKLFDIMIEVNQNYINKIAEDQKRTTNMIDAINVGIIEIDGQTYDILNINKAAAKLIGLSKEDVIGKRKCYETLCEFHDVTLCPLHHKKLKETVVDECFITPINNDKLLVYKTAVKIPTADSFNIIESIIDLSDRQKKESELVKAKAKADLATKSKTVLLSNVSHDIRNLLASIQGTAERLYSRAGHENIYYNDLDIILNSIYRMTQSVELMRERTVLEIGKSKLQLQSMNFDDILNRIAETYKTKCNYKRLEFNIIGPLNQDIFNKLDLTTDLNLVTIPYNINKLKWVKCDSAKLDAILGNLLGNAVKFTKSGGIIWSIVIIKDTITYIEVEFRITDTGIGIPKNVQDTIFNMYEQADDSIQEEFGGTGLGLSICQQYIHMMGGTLEMESEPDIGSTFSFQLMFEKTEPIIEVDLDILINNHFTNLQILAAEDSESIRMILKDKFTSLGHNLTLAVNGQEAIEKIQSDYFDMVFFDIRMPIMGGVEAVEQLRNNNYTLPIIALTANFSEIDVEKYIKIGFDDCLGKPININEIKKTIMIYKSTHLFNISNYDNLYTNSDLFEKILPKIKKEFNDIFSRLEIIIYRDYIDDLKIEEFEELSHTIKGSAASMCFDSVYHIAWNLERIASKKYIRRELDKTIVNNLIIKLKDQFNKSLDYYEREVKPR